MADWLRNAGLNVIEYPGWQQRARGSGGFNQYPLCVMWHHTASSANWDGQQDADYIAEGDEDSPVSNLYIERSGAVWVIAAGGSNTNGKGGPLSFSRGTVAVDCMNSNAVGVEMGNNGVGEAWPQSQIDAMFLVSNVMNSHMGNQPSDVANHQTWAPTRKIDPATASAVQGPWKPRASNSSGTWHQGDIIDECMRRMGSPIPPIPVPPNPDDGDDDMLFDGLWKRDNANDVFALYKNGTKIWIPDEGMLNAFVALQTINGATPDAVSVKTQTDPGMFAAFGVVNGPRPQGTDEWGNIP